MSTEALLILIAAWVVLPVSFALYMGRKNPKGEKSSEMPPSISSSQTKKEQPSSIRLERELEELQKSFKDEGRKLSTLKGQRQHLEVRLRKTRSHFDALDKALKRKNAQKDLQEQLDRIKREKVELEEQVKTIRIAESSSSELLTRLNDELCAKQLAVAHTRSMENANRMIETTTSSRASKAIDAAESIVQSREAHAAWMAECVGLNMPPDNRPQLSSTTLTRIDEIASSVLWFMDMPGHVRSLIVIGDPSIDRAYRRLFKEFQVATILTERSEDFELRLEQDANNASASLRPWRFKTSADLADFLKLHKRRNLATQDSLFRVEAIIHRLYVLKLLISGLPGNLSQDVATYKKVTGAVMKYLISSKELKVGIEPLEERIGLLEYDVLKAYIRIAKDKCKSLRAKKRNRLSRDLTSISADLKEELSVQQSEYEKWHVMEQQAIEEDKKLLTEVASDRRQLYENIARTTEQSLEILSAILNQAE